MAETNATNATMLAVDTVSEELHSSFGQLLTNAGASSVANNQWLMFLAIVVVGFAISYILVYLSKTVIKQFTKRTETDLDDILLEKLQHPAALSLFILSLNVALVPLSLSGGLVAALNKLLVSVNIVLLAIMVNRVFSIIVARYGEKIAAQTDSAVDDHVFPIVKKIIMAVIFVIAILFIFTVWGIAIAPLLAGAGIAGIALAFSMQESLKNIFGGVSLAFDGAYGIGDRIKLSDGTVGVVHDISLRSTKIKLFTGDLIVVPNGKIANENFTTYAQPTMATAVVVPFSVAYGTDTDKVKKLIEPLVKDVPHYMVSDDHKTTVDFLEMGPHSLNFRVLFWVDDYTKSWDAKLLVNDRIYKTLQKNKIEIPFPTTTVIMRK